MPSCDQPAIIGIPHSCCSCTAARQLSSSDFRARGGGPCAGPDQSLGVAKSAEMAMEVDDAQQGAGAAMEVRHSLGTGCAARQGVH